jgi:hypothetical protein
MEDGSKKLLKSAEVGFALAGYSHGDDTEPVKFTFADECHAKFLQREARLASKPAPNRKRRQPATAQAAQPATAQDAALASSSASIRKRHQPPSAQAPTPTPL